MRLARAFLAAVFFGRPFEDGDVGLRERVGDLVEGMSHQFSDFTFQIKNCSTQATIANPQSAPHLPALSPLAVRGVVLGSVSFLMNSRYSASNAARSRLKYSWITTAPARPASAL